MPTDTIAQLERFGPDGTDTMAEADARRWCTDLAVGHYENFSVLSRLVPNDRRDDFAAVYAFCRWADDLGDETGSPEDSSRLLDWWQQELDRCYEGSASHPVFVALSPTIERFSIPRQPFSDLIAAFQQDQTVTRYQTWDGVLDYCARSADPVGRLVLMMLDVESKGDLLARSDDICTALQLTNHWQDVRRDILDRDRIYLPTELFPIEDFERRLRESARAGHAVDQTFLGEYRTGLKTCVERTWTLFQRGEALLTQLDPEVRPLIWLFAAGGRHVLHQVEMWNFETCLHRPRLTKFVKARILLSARWKRRRARRAGGRST
ncbi:MAG: squalene synthase HpnC [Planctomycetota bacterium]